MRIRRKEKGKQERKTLKKNMLTLPTISKTWVKLGKLGKLTLGYFTNGNLTREAYMGIFTLGEFTQCILPR